MGSPMDDPRTNTAMVTAVSPASYVYTIGLVTGVSSVPHVCCHSSAYVYMWYSKKRASWYNRGNYITYGVGHACGLFP